MTANDASFDRRVSSGNRAGAPGENRLVDRAIVLVMDSVGIGELPDADRYGDTGSNTLVHTAQAVGGLHLPNLSRLGLGWLVADAPGVVRVEKPEGAYGRMAEVSPGKDTTTGHWEMMGLHLERPFPTYPHGFPPEVIEPFERAIGRRVLGNKPASGTEIIKELGELHLETGCPIVYTSADSVFQIAAHEEVIPVDELYRICEVARRILTGPHAVNRVIARPFAGKPGNFFRTERRRDFSLPPPRPTVLDALKEAGYHVRAVGKIEDIFAGRGITESVHTANNEESLRATWKYARESRQPGLIFTNCVDFDMLYGHRNDAEGYARALEELDAWIPQLLAELGPRDILVITADHGCDPTTPSTDHSREYVPLLVAGPAVRAGIDLGTRRTFADLGVTLVELFGLPGDHWATAGESFAAAILAWESPPGRT
ncbi:MAG: phosphopentomutase [Limnochordales bacterium]|nr:phosphopentomutase [Limnochordales bacterium]